jgi:hypothetical protein
MQQAGARHKIPPKIYSFIEKKANTILKKNGKIQKSVTQQARFPLKTGSM